jgi:ParB family chromosome partitioning protein
MTDDREDRVELIPINSVHILNPRDRNKRRFRSVVESIATVGLKRPITVSRRQAANGRTNSGKQFDLVCGQGRVEAFKELGETSIPAIIIQVDPEECYLLSLVENLARRHHTPLELMRSIGVLSDAGYGPADIAAKTGLSREYVSGIINLISNGEDRLIAAVERSQIPVSVAVDIASADDDNAQQALTEAYARKELRGQKLQIAMRVVRNRARFGKKLAQGQGRQSRTLTAQAMVRAYRQETERQRNLVRKADLTENRLLVITNAMRVLFDDEHFVTLLRAEGLETLPRQLADRIIASGGGT